MGYAVNVLGKVGVLVLVGNGDFVRAAAHAQRKAEFGNGSVEHENSVAVKPEAEVYNTQTCSAEVDAQRRDNLVRVDGERNFLAVGFELFYDFRIVEAENDSDNIGDRVALACVRGRALCGAEFVDKVFDRPDNFVYIAINLCGRVNFPAAVCKAVYVEIHFAVSAVIEVHGVISTKPYGKIAVGRLQGHAYLYILEVVAEPQARVRRKA